MSFIARYPKSLEFAHNLKIDRTQMWENQPVENAQQPSLKFWSHT